MNGSTPGSSSGSPSPGPPAPSGSASRSIPASPTDDTLEAQIAAWRSHLRRSQAVTDPDAEELEDHLREQIDLLGKSGLAKDEAFLVAVKRMGAIDALTREFAREHSDRLWKQLVLSGEGGGAASPMFGTSRMWMALMLGVAAAAAIKLPVLFGVDFDFELNRLFYPTNVAFLTLPFIVIWFAWERPLSGSSRLGLAGAFALAALVINLLPFDTSADGVQVADTHLLSILHLPIALWLLVGVAYAGGRWRASARRMDFLRFTGELFIYYVLIALGGGVLTGLTLALFQSIGLDLESLVGSWIVPCGAAGAILVATWLVEAKQSVIENIAPVLARVFVPLFALVLLTFVVTMVATGRGIDVEREILIAVDALLVLVFGLLLYSISARDPLAPTGPLDWIQLLLVGTALLVDALALWAIGARISDFGWTPNRFAGLGMNIVLLINLAGSSVLYLRFVRGEGAISRIWDWQMTYLYVIAAWAAFVTFFFPMLFGLS